jgi:hypothetical protein
MDKEQTYLYRLSDSAENGPVVAALQTLNQKGLEVYDLNNLDDGLQRDYAAAISREIDEHPEFRMLPKTPQEILEKDAMLVVVDAMRDFKLVACGGHEAESGGQMEIGTLFTVPELDRNGESYRKHGLCTILTAILTQDVHQQDLGGLAFCNENSVHIFNKLGYHEAYLEEEVDPASIYLCKTECVAYRQATDRINRQELLARIAAADSELEKARLSQYLVRLDTGAKALRCCDVIMVLPNGEPINYEAITP